MKQGLNKNTIGAVLFIFTAINVVFHSHTLSENGASTIISNGNIVYDLYFIVSGCLMCAFSEKRVYANSIGRDTWDFLKYVIYKIYPNYLLGSVIAFVVFHICSGNIGLKNILVDALKCIPELLLIKNSGLRLPSHNFITWGISAIFLNLLVLYPLLRKYKDDYFVLAAVVALYIVGYFYQKYGTISNLETWNGFILKGTLRATMGMCAGSLCYKVGCEIGRNQFTLFGKTVLTVFEWFCYCFAILLCFKFQANHFDYLVFFMFVLGFAITFSNAGFDDRIFKSKIFSNMGEFSLSLYVGHLCWSEYAKNVYPKGWDFKQQFAVYIIASILTATLILVVSRKIRSYIKNNKKKIKSLFIKSQDKEEKDSGGTMLFKKLKKHRFLFEELVKRDFKKKYKRTVLGMAWSVLSPVLTLIVMKLVFTQFFGRTMLHFTTYLFCGNLIFSFFNESTTQGMTSLRNNASIFTKVNVPKYLFLLSKNVQCLINFGLTLCVFFVFCAFDKITFTWKFLMLLYPIILLVVFNIGLGMILSALYVFFRDIQYLWSVFTMLLMYLSAIFYTIDKFTPTGQNLFLLNPVYVFIHYFREIVIQATIPTFGIHMLMLANALLYLGIGCHMYKKYNHRFLYYV